MSQVDHPASRVPAATPVPPPAVPVGARAARADRWAERLRWPLGTLRFFGQRLIQENVVNTAAALCFSTALSVVPALALIFGVLAAFPIFGHLRDQVQNFITASLVPDIGLKMQDQLTAFIQAAGQLTIFGFLGLVFTAGLLLLTIEDAFNRIFRVAHLRPFFQRLGVLCAAFILGPLTVGISMMLLGYAAGIASEDESALVKFLLGHVLPTLLSWPALTFLYRIVPHRPVNIGDALMGGALGALLLEALRVGFTIYVGTTTYGAIYGAVAAVPVFLMWIYCLWLAVMAGAVVAAGLPDWRLIRSGQGTGPGHKLALALAILDVLAATQRDGGMAPEDISKAVSVPEAGVLPVLEELRKAKYVTVNDAAFWNVARDLFRTPLVDLVHRFGLGVGPAVTELQGTALGARICGYLEPAATAEKDLLRVCLSDLLSRDESTPKESASKKNGPG